MSLEGVDVGLLGAERPGLLLGRFDAETVRGELEEAGLLAALAERGYPDVRVSVDAEPGEHRLLVRARGGRVNLMDLRLAETTSSVDEPLARQHGLEVLSLLTIRWLALQHPKGRFTRERPRLPGQRFPGLGFTKPVVLRLLHWAKAWGKDGLANVPEYYHNAVFYSAIFRFTSPERQGRFEALRRDLASLPVARASAAVEKGRVLEERSGAPFAWLPGEMLSPLTTSLQAYLDSAAYAQAVAESRGAVRFRLTSP